MYFFCLKLKTYNYNIGHLCINFRKKVLPSTRCCLTTIKCHFILGYL